MSVALIINSKLFAFTHSTQSLDARIAIRECTVKHFILIQTGILV